MDKYIRYGDEWEKEINKLTKGTIIDMIRRVAKERDLLAAKIPCPNCGATETVTKCACLPPLVRQDGKLVCRECRRPRRKRKPLGKSGL